MTIFEVGVIALVAVILCYWLAIGSFVRAYNKRFEKFGWHGPLLIWSANPADSFGIVTTLFRVQVPREEQGFSRAAAISRVLFVILSLLFIALFVSFVLRVIPHG